MGHAGNRGAMRKVPYTAKRPGAGKATQIEVLFLRLVQRMAEDNERGTNDPEATAVFPSKAYTVSPNMTA